MSLIRQDYTGPDNFWSKPETYDLLFVISASGIVVFTVIRALAYALMIKKICDRLCASFLDKAGFRLILTRFEASDVIKRRISSIIMSSKAVFRHL